MDYNQWRSWLLRDGRALHFGDMIGTPLILASEEEINRYLAREGFSNAEAMAPLEE